MSLHDLSSDVLAEARIDLDHQIAALRERKLAIARELESRFPDARPKPRPAQAVAPGFVEAESSAFGPSDPEPDVEPEPEPAAPKRRWWK